MNKIRVAVEPRLRAAFGPEIDWTLRLLLTGMGWAWEEVDIQEECALAFTSCPESAPRASIVILAKPEYWEHPSAQRLSAVSREAGFDHLVFHGEQADGTIVKAEAGRIIIRRDILFDIFWLVTGQEERHFPKDRHGFFDLSGTVYQKENIMQEATASQIMVWLERLLIEQGCPEPMHRWRDGKRGAFCLNLHVDYPEVIRWLQPVRFLLSRGVDGIKPALKVLLGRNHHWHFRSWMELAKTYGMRAAFFFVPRKGSLFKYLLGLPDPFYEIDSPRFRDVFREIRAENFEIGMHASYLAYQSVEKFRAEKEHLEKVSGGQVKLVQHHYWHLNPMDIEETLWMHEQVGLISDGSLTHDRFIGWRRGISFPFFPYQQSLRRELATLQMQTVWMDNQLFRDKKFNPGDRQLILNHLTERTAQQGGCMAVVMHEYIFDGELYPGWVKTFRGLMDAIKARGDIWIASPGEIAEHWSQRYRKLVQASVGLSLGKPTEQKVHVPFKPALVSG